MVSKAKKQWSQEGVSFEINLDSFIEFLAAGNSFTHSVKDRDYLDAIIDISFNKADERFNRLAVAAGQSGKIAHMYEWGTLGINKGKTNVRMSPNNPGARLWENYLEGTGTDRLLYLAFKPSVAYVPKPTRKETNMPREAIDKMRKYVFRWKAKVMEEGTRVTIKRKKAKYLLIPATDQNKTWMKPSDIKRGYALAKGPIYAKPGKQVAGNFSTMWFAYWTGPGVAMVIDKVNEQLILDYEPEFRVRRTASSSRPIGHYKNMDAKVKAESKKITSKVKRKAKSRRMSGE